MEKLVWQMFILGTGNLDIALKKGLGGVIFFTKDIISETQFIDLICDIKSKAIIPPFLSIDQEGGRVERTENIRPKRLSAKLAYELGEDFLKSQYDEIAKELSNWGINLNFAPCADVNTNPANPIIGERAFADNPIDVQRGLSIVVNSLRNSRVIPCVKHFPGHGDANKDSHLTLPVIDISLKGMENIHIAPFKYAIENNIEMIMVAHLHCTCFDKEAVPASLSKNVLQYLRKTLKYEGVLISDDMVMKGVQAYGALDAVIMGIEAGIDMFIFRDSSNETLKIIEELISVVKKDTYLQQRVLQANKRIEKLKQKYL